METIRQQKDPALLREIDLFLLDMDGTFYLGNRLYPGSRVFMDAMAARPEKDFLFLTNNSSKNRASYADKITAMGFSVPEEKIFTSGEATTLYLTKKAPEAGVFLVGTPDLEREFAAAGFRLTDTAPDFAVLGFDTTLTYEKLWKLCDFVRAGVPYIATHPDFNCPIEGGFMPDIGAMIAFVEAATGCRPQIIGKPYGEIVDAVVEKTGVPKERMAMVGDRLYTDIAMGANAGIVSVLVLSGETTMEDLDGSDIQPDYIFPEIGAIAQFI